MSAPELTGNRSATLLRRIHQDPRLFSVCALLLCLSSPRFLLQNKCFPLLFSLAGYRSSMIPASSDIVQLLSCLATETHCDVGGRAPASVPALNRHTPCLSCYRLPHIRHGPAACQVPRENCFRHSSSPLRKVQVRPSPLRVRKRGPEEVLETAQGHSSGNRNQRFLFWVRSPDCGAQASKTCPYLPHPPARDPEITENPTVVTVKC
uniref:Uncharacterized protein n=1 Tax=Rousettus aegyptiacus TaxID=9407 RepID=A0A7J8B9H6_ROUAE|nr:hypothetical protein HJG63_009921 [Rousettus aegyptiacus]